MKNHPNNEPKGFLSELKSRAKVAFSILAGRKLRDRDVLQFSANVDLTVQRANGKVEKYAFHNLIVTAGKNLILDASSPGYLKDFKYMGVGTDSTAAAISDTALGAQSGSRSSAITATNPSSGTLRFSATFTGISATLREMGLFTASSGGTMLNRIVYGAITLTSGDSLIAQIDIT